MAVTMKQNQRCAIRVDPSTPTTRNNSVVVQTLLCPITHALMVDPVLTEDGYTYDRSSIIEWLSKNPISPLVPNKQLSMSNLRAVVGIQEAIEALVVTGAVEKKLADSWKVRKWELNLVKAKGLFNEGRILDAAKLGLPKAQGQVSSWYFIGINGVDKDLEQSFEWAKKAAEGGDRLGQFRLANFYDEQIGNLAEAIIWYERAANQGCSDSMYNLGHIYINDGCDLDRNYLQKAIFWYEKGANENNVRCLVKIGILFYKGIGVTKSNRTARDWFEKAVDSIDDGSEKWLEANFWLGKMMMRGEGGIEDMTGGIDLIQKAAYEGLPLAKQCLKSMMKVLD